MKIESLTLDREQAAKYTGLSIASIDREIVAKRLKAKKYGKRVLILRSEAERFVESLPDLATPDTTPDQS